MINLCAPAIIYVIFSVTQILIDLYKGMYNTAFMKVIVASMVTLLLNILCERGLNVVSWIIVFIPFILMTIMVSMLLYFFGLDAATGTLDYTCKDRESTTKVVNNKNNTNNKNNMKGVSQDVNGNILIYDPEYDEKMRPVYYEKPNIIVPNPYINDINDISNIKQNHEIVPKGSSSPEYQS